MIAPQKPIIDLFEDDDIPVIGGSSVSVTPQTVPLAAQVVPPTPPASTPRQKFRRPADPFLDDPEIAELSKKTPAPEQIPWRDIVRRSLEESGVAFSTPEAQNRCVAVGDTFVRGVRDHIAAKMRLLAPIDRGGAGLSADDAHKCIQVLKRATEFHTKEHVQHHGETKKKYVAQNIAALVKDSTAHDEADKKLEDRFRALTRNVGRGKTGKAAEASLPIVSPEHELMKRVEARLAVPPKQLKVTAQAPTTPLRRITVASQEQSTPKPPAPPVIPKEKTLVTDVRHSPRLVGPIEELEAMSLQDFRKISRFPKEGVRRISEKIENLTSQGHLAKQKGIEAWQRSPIGREYFSILSEVVRGKPLDQVLAARIAAGEPTTLTKEEFTALMELNQAVRFA